MKKFGLLIASVLFSACIISTPGHALPTQVVNLGDTEVEVVQTGNSGTSEENLEYWFAENGITNEDGSAVNPMNDQLQDEMFYTDETKEYEVEFLGIGHAQYHSPFGIFTYEGNPYDPFDPTKIVYHDALFVQNEVDVNTTYNFTVEAGTYFGFYLDSNGSGTTLSTMNAANSDGEDHALFFNTNKGYTIAFEDIVGGGDRDYEDLVINFRPADDSGFEPEPVPEPSTMLLLAVGLLGVVKVKFARLKK